DVELRQREPVDAVQTYGVAQRDQVEPAAAALAAGHRPVLAAELAQPFLVGTHDLGWERPLADARHVRLGDADHAVDPSRPDPRPDRRAARHRRGGGDEGIRAVIEVEQRPMGAVEEDPLSFSECAVHKERGVDDERAKPFGVRLVLLDEAFELDRLLAVDALEPEVLLGERDLDLLAEDLRVEDVLHADPQAHRLVGVTGPYASLRRPDRELAEAPLARLVDGEV